MASLTHVCMWSDNGWKHISAEEASRLHPGGTVSAHSGLFMCELCGQYVILTDGDIKVRYFKHSAYEKSKDCPERTFGSGCSITYRPEEHDLPIRISGVSSSSFRFEIGLIRAPISALSNNFRILIRPKGVLHSSFIFTKERLNYDSITYLPIGDQPYIGYEISIENGNDKLKDFWPEKINGINPEGALFEKTTGKMLLYDADVEIGKEYYLLKRGSFYYRNTRNGMSIQEIAQKRFSWETWNLYTVSASEFNESTARFFLDFHCRLTECPVSLKPVWPLFTEGSFIVQHNQNSIYMLVSGNASAIRTFPAVCVNRLSNHPSNPKLYEVFCSGRQQLISAGRTRALQYTYFWREPLVKEGVAPEISVTDLNGNEISAGEISTLPHGKSIRINSLFDGEIVISNNGNVIDKQNLQADKLVELDNITYGLHIQVIVGLDCVWEIQSKKRQDVVTDNESEILRYITTASGVFIPVPHSLRNILNGMQKYPQISQWIRSRILDGSINEQSYRKLQKFYRSMIQNRQGGTK